MAARVLSEVGRGPGALGWAYALTLGFGLVYLGEHYVVDLVAGLRAVRGRPPRHPARGADGLRAARRDPATGARSSLMAVRAEDEEDVFEEDHEEDERVSGMGAMLLDRRRLTLGVLLVLALIAAIYVLFPRIVGLDGELARISDATWYWVVIAVVFNVAAFGAYVALFRGVLGGNAAAGVRRRLDANATLPDHDGRPGRHADLLGGRRGRNRADLLGAAQGRACRAGARPAGWSPSWC